MIAACDARSSTAGLAELCSTLEVETLLETVAHHRVTPAVHTRIADLSGVPNTLLERLRMMNDEVQATRLHAYRALEHFTLALDARFLVVKGPALIAQAHTQGYPREFSDLDVLVRPADFERAVEGLTAAGFEPLATNWHGFLDHGVAEIPLRFEWSTIDLHWNLVALGATRRHIRLSTDACFKRAIEVRLGNVDVLTLDPVDTLLHVCINTGLDGARRLRGLLDIDTIVRSGRADLDELVVRAHTAGAGRLSVAVLQRARRVLGTPVPDSSLQRLSPGPTWLLANDIVDRIGVRRRNGQTGIASGILLSAGRDDTAATLKSVAENLRKAVAERAGRPGITQEGGELDWQRLPERGDADAHRRRYLDFVNASAAAGTAVRRRRCTDADELHRLIGELQPRTTPMLGAAFVDGIGGRRCRADLFEFEDGSLAAATVRYRWTIGRMTAYPLLLDARAAGVVGAFLQRSGATDLSGMEQDTDPLRPHLARWRGSDVATPAWQPPGFIWEAPGDDVRVATQRDLDDLVDAVWTYSPHAFPNKTLLRRRLKRAIDQLTLVIEAGSPAQPAGFGILDSSTPEYDFWAQLVILPEYRELGLSWRLVAAGAAEAARRGAGGMVCVVETNPMTLPSDATTGDLWNYVTLSPPRRFRGEVRLRRLLDRLLGIRSHRVDTAQPVMRTPGPGDDRVGNRRTQQWWRRGVEEGSPGSARPPL